MAKEDLRHKFVAAWETWGFDQSDLQTEYRFHPTRRWRFDVAFPSLRVAVECDGHGFGHQSIGGRKADHEKANAAAESGWIILRYTPSELTRTKAQETIEQVCRVLEMRASVRSER